MSGDTVTGPASQFLIALGGAISQAQLYEPENKILLAPIGRLDTLLRELLGQGALFGFQGRDQTIFVNETRLRCDGPTYLRLQEVEKQLEIRRISGMTFTRELNVEQWKALLFAVARCDRKSPGVFDDIVALLKKKGLSSLVALAPLLVAAPRDGVAAPAPEAPAGGGGEAASPPAPANGSTTARGIRKNARLFAARTYAKAMLLLREFYRSVDDREASAHIQIRLQRTVLDLVAVCEQRGWRHFGLVHNKKLAEYIVNHSVNVAVLSLILGLRMKISRPRLAELAMAAFMHDLGKSRLPPELMDKPGAFTEEERRQVATAPLLGLRGLLAIKPCNDSLLKRMTALAEHHLPVAEHPGTHVYSRIIAVSEAFDALTSERPYRAAYAPDDAVRTLASMAGKRLDPALTAAFIQSVGVFPCGSLVELTDGALALVVDPPARPQEWRMPTVRLLNDPDKRLIDLSRPLPGETARAVQRSVDPRPLGINVTALLYEAPLREAPAF